MSSFKVKAIYEYNSPHEDDLKFPIGQVITVTEEEDAEWYAGEYVDDAGRKQEGIFPRNFVEKYEPTAPPRPTRTRTKKDPEPEASAAISPASPTLPPPYPWPNQNTNRSRSKRCRLLRPAPPQLRCPHRFLNRLRRNRYSRRKRLPLHLPLGPSKLQPL